MGLLECDPPREELEASRISDSWWIRCFVRVETGRLARLLSAGRRIRGCFRSSAERCLAGRDRLAVPVGEGVSFIDPCDPGLCYLSLPSGLVADSSVDIDRMVVWSSPITVT